MPFVDGILQCLGGIKAYILIPRADRDCVQQFAFAGFVAPVGRGLIPVLSPCCIDGERSWSILQLGDIGLECC